MFGGGFIHIRYTEQGLLESKFVSQLQQEVELEQVASWLSMLVTKQDLELWLH